MTRRNRCLLPWPSDRGEGTGYQWSFDNFFDGIDSETEAVCDFEEIDGLDCPPMDKAYFNCEANFNWMMDGNFFDGINNCAPVDSKATQECNKNKGSRCGKGKPQGLIVPNLQSAGEDMEKTEAVCDFEEIDGLDCSSMDETYFKCEAKLMDGNFFDGINNCAPVDSKATQECNKNKGSRCGKGKPQSLIVPDMQPPGEDMEKTESVGDFEEIDGLDCPPMDEAYFKCEANFNWMMDGINNWSPVNSKATKDCNKNKGSQCRKGKPQSLIVHNLQSPCEDMETEAVCDFEETVGLDCPPMDEAYFKCEANFNCMMDGINNCAPVDSKATKECNKNKGSQCRKRKPQSLIVHNLQPICKGKERQKVSKMQNTSDCDKGKELKKVVDLYSETKTQNKVACGKGKDIKNVIALYRKKMAADADKRYELKLESTKRKLQEDYEKCKKMRKIQLIGQADLPKPEDQKARSKAVCSFPKRICKPTTVKQRVSQKLRTMKQKKKVW